MRNPPEYCRFFVQYFECKKEFGEVLESNLEYQQLMDSIRDTGIIENISKYIEREACTKDLLELRETVNGIYAMNFSCELITELKQALAESLAFQIEYLKKTHPPLGRH